MICAITKEVFFNGTNYVQEELGTFSVGYLKGIIEEMLLSRMVIMGASTFDVKMERPFKD
jgi:hypothetical protein